MAIDSTLQIGSPIRGSKFCTSGTASLKAGVIVGNYYDKK